MGGPGSGRRRGSGNGPGTASRGPAAPSGGSGPQDTGAAEKPARKRTGRPPGPKDKINGRAANYAERLANARMARRILEDGGLLPAEVMIVAMRKHAEEGRWDEAAAIAKDVAPYFHPRLNAVDFVDRTKVSVKEDAPRRDPRDIAKVLLLMLEELHSGRTIDGKVLAPAVVDGDGDGG